MIPEYNKINPETDSRVVIESKIQAIKAGVARGSITVEEMEIEKEKLELAFSSGKLGYAFTW